MTVSPSRAEREYNMIYSHTIEPGLDVYLVDGRTKAIPTKEYLDYRKEELAPVIAEGIEKAWAKGHTVYHSTVDAVISMQSESLEKAVRYIGYRFLGTHSYLDVFGKYAQEEYRWLQHQRQNESMEEQLTNMQKQMWDMQKLLINISKQQNNNIATRKTG